MTQVARPQEPKKEVRPGLTDNYTPAANVLIQGFSELSISERYVAIGLVSLYWDEKVYAVSLRELASKIQIDHTMLRSRGGKRPAEGILDKLWRLGIIALMEGKPLTELGTKGRVQTYIQINHKYIAERNLNYTLDKKVKSPRYTVGITNSQKKSHTVGDTNHTVGDTNHTVGDTNHTVGDTNHTVVHVSVKVPPNNSKNSNNLEEKKNLLPSHMQLTTKDQGETHNNSYSQDQQPTNLQEKSIETVKPPVAAGYTNASSHTITPVIPDLRQGLREQTQECKQETSAQIKKRMERRKDDIFTLYARLTGVAKVVKSKENHDGADMLIDVDATDEHITIAVQEIQADQFWSKQMNLRVVASQLQNRVSERSKRNPTKTVTTSASPISLEDEKNKRNLERLRQSHITKLQDRMSKNGKFQQFELVQMVERYGMELAPYLMEQYNSAQRVAVSQ